MCLATHAIYENSVRRRGLDFFALAGDPHEILASDEGRRWQDAGGNPFRFSRGFMRVIRPLMEQVLTQCWNAGQGADAIIVSVLGLYAGYHIAEKLRVPLISAFYLPITPTRAFPSAMLPTEIAVSGGLNRWTHHLSNQLLGQPLRPALNRLRREILELPPISFWRMTREVFHEQRLILYGYSPSLLPKPPDWGDRIHVTGYWFLDRPSEWQPPTDLSDFLNAGKPPVYIGFGSMFIRDAEETTALIVRALAVSGQRGVLLTGRNGLSRANLPDYVFDIVSIPHDWLFPRMAAIVYHGGAGTTGAALRAGVPSVTVPFFGDQPFWGRQIFRLGVGTRPIPRERLTTERLADAIRVAISDRDMRGRAAALGQRICVEDGVARAVDAFQRQWR